MRVGGDVKFWRDGDNKNDENTMANVEDDKIRNIKRWIVNDSTNCSTLRPKAPPAPKRCCAAQYR